MFYQWTPLRPHSSVCFGEVFTYRRLKMLCLYAAGTSTECPLRRGVSLQKVSVSGGSTVLFFFL